MVKNYVLSGILVAVVLGVGFTLGQNTTCFNAFGLSKGCLFKVPSAVK